MLKSHLYLVFPRAVCIVAYVVAGPEINGIKEKLRRAKKHLRRFCRLPFLKGVVN